MFLKKLKMLFLLFVTKKMMLMGSLAVVIKSTRVFSPEDNIRLAAESGFLPNQNDVLLSNECYPSQEQKK